MLVTQTFEDPFRRVPLLAVNLPVTAQNLVNDRKVGSQLRCPRLRAPLAGGFRVSQDLLQRFPVNRVLGTSCPFADLADQYPSTDLGPFLHIRKHPCLLLTFGTELPETGKSDLISAGEHLGATPLLQFCHSSPGATFSGRCLHVKD